MKKRIISGVAAMSLALATFVLFGITASAATTYTASAYTNSKPVSAKGVNQGDIFEKGAYIKQDGGGRNWYLTDARSILFLTYANNPTYTGTSETRNDLTVQVKGNDRYKYWKVTIKDSDYIEDYINNRYDYKITLSPNDPSYKAPTAKSPTYNGNAQALANAATSVSGCTVKYSTDNSSWSSSVPKGTDAGKYTVYYKVEHSDYFNNNLDTTANFTVTINKADAAYTTEPAGKTVTWTGADQELVSEGAATFGTVQYKLGDGEWSTEIPKAKAAGTYTVYYKVDGNNNYNGIAGKSVTATIEDKAATATYKNVHDINEGYDGQASTWTVTVTPGNTAITSIDVKVNGIQSNEGAWNTGTTLSGGPITFGVAVNAAAEKVTSMAAVVNGADVQATID